MFGTPGFMTKSSIWLLSRMPGAGTTMPVPNQPLSVMVPPTPIALGIEHREVRGVRALPPAFT